MLRVRVFGGLALESDGTPLELPPSRRARELLGWLALHPGRHARAAVAARLWPDVLDTSARASLRTTLHELRRALGAAGGCLVADRDTVALDGAWVDAREVEALLASGRVAEALGRAARRRGPRGPRGGVGARHARRAARAARRPSRNPGGRGGWRR